MEVGSPANNHYLSIAWIAQVSRQLPLSGPVPTHVEEDLDDDKYYNHSETEGVKKSREESRIKHNIVKYCVINEAKYIYIKKKAGDLLTCTSTAPFVLDH